MGAQPTQDGEEDGSESLGELVFRALEQRELEGDAALEALFREHPEHAAELRERLALDYAERACVQIRAWMGRATLPKPLGQMLDYGPLHGLAPFERLLAERERDVR